MSKLKELLEERKIIQSLDPTIFSDYEINQAIIDNWRAIIALTPEDVWEEG